MISAKAFTAELAAIVKNRLKCIQYRPELAGGFLAADRTQRKARTTIAPDPRLSTSVATTERSGAYQVAWRTP